MSGPYDVLIDHVVAIADAIDGGEKEATNGDRLRDALGRIAEFYGENPAGHTLPNQEASTAGSYTALKEDFNALLAKLKEAGIMVADEWNLSVLACPTPASMPTAETASNSGHATVSFEDNVITVALDCKVSALADANHGTTWGTHKWLGFGVRTGLASVVGLKFADDTGAKATLAADDASEATALGLSAGDFVLYIKAENEKYLTGEKFITLKADGYEEAKITIRITEAAS